MLQLLQALLDQGTMETNFLAVIQLLDQIETIMTGRMLPNGQITPELVSKVAELKQAVIADFGRENAEATLAGVLKQVEEAEAAKVAEA